MTRQGVAILGSTGSVGTSTLDVVAALPDRFEVIALAAGANLESLQAQVDRYRPRYAALCAVEDGHDTLQGARVIDTPDPLTSIALLDEVDIVVVATTGHAALPATIAALEAGKIVALANKETIVAGGSIVMPIAKRHPGNLRPVDSEHSAIWQCLPGGAFDERSVRRILLTASGGPFRGMSPAELATVDVKQALAHPTWTMGSRITIDSATLMNKGFELIEAAWLFHCPIDRIRIIVHPQSIVHSMVEYNDGSILAQLGSHDMRLPIQYALTYPDRPAGSGERLSLDMMTRLEFEPPDLDAFPAPNIARAAARAGGLYPTVLSKADELAVAAFLAGRITFPAITDLVQSALDDFHPGSTDVTLESIAETDAWTNEYVTDALSAGARR